MSDIEKLILTKDTKGPHCSACGNPWWIEKIGGYVCSMCRLFKSHTEFKEEKEREGMNL